MSPAFFIHPSHPIRAGPAHKNPIRSLNIELHKYTIIVTLFDGISFPIMKFQSNSVPTQQLWLSSTVSPILSILYLSAKTTTIEPHSYLLPQYASLCPNCIRDCHAMLCVPCRASSAQTPPRPMSTPASIAHRPLLSGLGNERPMLYGLILYVFQQPKKNVHAHLSGY